MRLASAILGLIATQLAATTLERLSLDEMAQKSTEIVSARVIGSSATARGPVLYTRYRIQVVQRWKGAPAAELDVHVPGGRQGAVRQTFAGAPRLVEGEEYLLFLWTGKSGLTQVIGLSQGVFEMKRDAKGEVMVSRNASTETMVDAGTGQVVEDRPVLMKLIDMSNRIHRALAAPTASQ